MFHSEILLILLFDKTRVCHVGNLLILVTDKRISFQNFTYSAKLIKPNIFHGGILLVQVSDKTNVFHAGILLILVTHKRIVLHVGILPILVSDKKSLLCWNFTDYNN